MLSLSEQRECEYSLAVYSLWSRVILCDPTERTFIHFRNAAPEHSIAFSAVSGHNYKNWVRYIEQCYLLAFPVNSVDKPYISMYVHIDILICMLLPHQNATCTPKNGSFAWCAIRQSSAASLRECLARAATVHTSMAAPQQSMKLLTRLALLRTVPTPPKSGPSRARRSRDSLADHIRKHRNLAPLAIPHRPKLNVEYLHAPESRLAAMLAPPDRK